MLRFVFLTAEGENLILGNPISVLINRDEDIPADDLSAVFAFGEAIPELAEVRLFDGDSLCFKGIVDEQQVLISEKNTYMRIVARNMAALLLDNEAKPAIYYTPSASVVISRHLAPLGFSDYEGENKILQKRFTVTKGMSEWQVIESFCRKTFGKKPWISESGRLYLNGIPKGDKVTFSDCDGIQYIFLKENIRRCKELSDVSVKVEEGGNYSSVTENTAVKEKGIIRKRYYDASKRLSENDVAALMMEKAAKAAYELTIKVPARMIDALGAEAVVRDSCLGEKDNLYVSSLSYSLNSDGEITTLLLRKQPEAGKKERIRKNVVT